MKKILMALAAAATVTAAPVVHAIPVSATIDINMTSLSGGSIFGANVTITNSSISSAALTDVIITLLPASWVFDTVTGIGGGTSPNPPSPFVATVVNNTNVLSLAGSLAPGGSVTFSIDIDPAPAAADSFPLTPTNAQLFGSLAQFKWADPGTTVLNASFGTGPGGVAEATAALPEPGSLALLGGALAGLGVIRRKRRTS